VTACRQPVACRQFMWVVLPAAHVMTEASPDQLLNMLSFSRWCTQTGPKSAGTAAGITVGTAAGTSRDSARPSLHLGALAGHSSSSSKVHLLCYHFFMLLVLSVQLAISCCSSCRAISPRLLHTAYQQAQCHSARAQAHLRC
jgi:hypothetical protein